MAKIIILGKGFVGNHLFTKLKDIDPFLNVSIFSRAEVDYFDEIHLKKCIRSTTFFDGLDQENIIINCSGFTGVPNVDQCEEKKAECFEYNVKLPIFLSQFCNKYKHSLIHISSGCIYTGYEKEFTEEDEPNFGFFDLNSSFYSKCKHLAEKLMLNNHTTVLRIRMPFCGYSSSRNLLVKLLKYDNLVKFKNSLTSIDDLSSFIFNFISRNYNLTDPGIYNVVNPGALDAEEITSILAKNNLINKNWKFVGIDTLNLKAGRSNCVLSTEKIQSLNLGLPPSNESLQICAQELSNVWETI